MSAAFITAALACVLVALLMFAVLRVNLDWDPRPGWRPDQPEPPPPSHTYVVIRVLRYSVLFPALLMGAIMHRGWLIGAALLVFVAATATEVVLRVRQASSWRREQETQGHLP
jgi:hypothetical protein